MKRIGAIFLLLASAARAQTLDLALPEKRAGVHAAIVGGAGIANGLLGAHVEVRRGQVAVFLGAGTMVPALSGGVRLFSGDGAGLLVCAHALKWLGDRSYAAGVTVGGRFRFANASFVEVGGGLAYADFPERLIDAHSAPGARRGLVVPDGNLALGYEF